MKKFIPFLLVLTSVFAPGALRGQSPAAAAENPAHHELRELRDGLLVAMNKGDLEGTLKFLHTNCVITWHNAEVSRGHAGVREYFNRVMTGPGKIVDSFTTSLKVDELTILYGEQAGICFGSSDEHFKLANGKDLDVKGRWSATLIKEAGRWQIASLHASTNLFDNVILDLAKKSVKIFAIITLILGFVVGIIIGRRRKSPVAAK